MTTITAKANAAYSNTEKKTLWERFKDYIVENQNIIIAAASMMSGGSYYTYARTLNR